MNQKFNKIITIMGLFRKILDSVNDVEIFNLEQHVLEDKQQIAHARTANDKAYWKNQLEKDQLNLKRLKQQRKK